MSKKYEFVEDDKFKMIDGAVLTRIRALRDIPERGVNAGDLGGFIETEENLPHDDGSWVCEKSWVVGKESRIVSSMIDDSTVDDTRVTRCKIEDSEIFDSTVEDSTVTDSRVIDSMIKESQINARRFIGSLIRKNHDHE